MIRHWRGSSRRHRCGSLSASLEEMLKRYAVQLAAHLLHHEAEVWPRKCADRKTEDGKAAVRYDCPPGAGVLDGV